MGIVRVSRLKSKKSDDAIVKANEKHYNNTKNYREGIAYWKGRHDGRVVYRKMLERIRGE